MKSLSIIAAEISDLAQSITDIAVSHAGKRIIKLEEIQRMRKLAEEILKRLDNIK